MGKSEEKQQKFDIEPAELEFKRFTDALRITPMKLKALEEEQENIIEHIQNGTVVVKDNGAIQLNLIYPLEVDGENPDTFNNVTFKCKRVRVSDLEKKMVGKNDIEKTRRALAFLTTENSGIFQKMDADDFKNCTDVAAFFLPR